MDNFPLVWQYVIQNIFEVSTLLPSDHITIAAHYTALLRNEKDSEKQLVNRNYPEHMIAAAKKNVRFPDVRIGGLVFTVPITRFKHPLLHYLITLLENYERGSLPFPGTISEQPSQVIEMLSLMQFLRSEHQQYIEKK